MSNSKLKPRYDIFGAGRLKDATFTGRFDFPFTPGTVLHESTLDGIPFDHISDRAIPVGAVLHFYVHDRRFLPFVEDPDRWMDRLERFPRVIGLDHSVYRDLPLAEQIHSLYLNRAMDWDLHRRGKIVIPNATWGDWRTFDFCFDGIEPGRTVAVSTHGTCQLRAAKYHFLQGLAELLDRLCPPSIVVHGPMFPELQELLAERSVQIIAMRSRTDKAHRKENCHEQV
jgi:hypothetical protein